MSHLFENKIYSQNESGYTLLAQAVMRSHPEILDDDLADFIDFSGEVEEINTRICLYCGKETQNGIYCNNNCRMLDRIEEERDDMIAEKDQAETKWDDVDREWERRFD